MIPSLLLIVVALVPLPEGAAPPALALPHFPDRLHALVWRNWQVTPAERIAAAMGATTDDILAIGHGMGLSGPPPISEAQWGRSYITVIRRNWHLLPYDQLLELLDWSPEKLAFTLREDDFLFHKLGNLKPRCAPVKFERPNAAILTKQREIARIVTETFGENVGLVDEPLFHFIEELSEAPHGEVKTDLADDTKPRFCHSYFGLYGDPLMDPEIDAYPEGYLARLRAVGVNGIWIHGMLSKLAPFPWDASLSENYETRLKNLNAMIARAKRHKIGVYLYLNEPRTLPLAFFETRPELKGATVGDHAALCTSVPEIQQYLRESVRSICRAAPDLAGIFTISASENPTNCWSHGQGAGCPHCAARPAAQVIAEVNSLINQGMRAAEHDAQLIAWDWGWPDAWAIDAIKALPTDVAVMSVSEWSLPIDRGGIRSAVGEYSISAIGPGPRAAAHWKAAQNSAHKVYAKVQAGTTWELGSVPYLPALNNVAEHALRLREANVDGIMLGWTLGGYPSPNLEVFARVSRGSSIEDALNEVATRRFGREQAEAVRRAWRHFSTALDRYPYDVAVVYNAPHHGGPANLLWAMPTGYRATMVGIPYDDLPSWRGPYPPDVLANQFALVADGFDRGVALLRKARRQTASSRGALRREQNVAEAAAIHFRSAANQARFVMARDRLAQAKTAADRDALCAEIEGLLNAEIALARRLHRIQSRDSRIGFEATNHYFFVPLDLAEKALNCRYLLDEWLPAERQRSASPDEL